MQDLGADAIQSLYRYMRTLFKQVSFDEVPRIPGQWYKGGIFFLG